jgi:hypothetical protein
MKGLLFKKLEIEGDWKLEIGDWKLEIGNWRLEEGEGKGISTEERVPSIEFLIFNF